jgi:hypothetical protein
MDVPPFRIIVRKFLLTRLCLERLRSEHKEDKRTERSIRTSRLLRSSAPRSMPILSISSYILSMLTSVSFASRSAARSCSSTVSSIASVSVRDSVRGRCGLSCSCCWRSNRFCRERSVLADAHRIWARISSCELRHLSWNSCDGTCQLDDRRPMPPGKRKTTDLNNGIAQVFRPGERQVIGQQLCVSVC